jgi:hypothetical protein
MKIAEANAPTEIAQIPLIIENIMENSFLVMINTSRFEGDDIPPRKTELGDGDGLGSFIRITEDQEIANCTLEFDEVMNAYVVTCKILKKAYQSRRSCSYLDQNWLNPNEV